MDERKKQIEDLEKSKRENLVTLDSLLERFGESLLGRAGEGAEKGGAFEDLAEYRRLQQEIAASEEAIKTVEDQIRRFRELEEKIELKEQEDGRQAKELAGVYGKLGKALLDASVSTGTTAFTDTTAFAGTAASADTTAFAGDASGVYTDFTAPFREQAEALVIKVRSLEERVAELDQKEGNNVFAWIGKSAQGLVLRSFLTKAQDSLEQLYRNVGERYSRRDNFSAGAAANESSIAGYIAEIEKVRSVARLLTEELIELREEKRGISETFGAEGSPLKQIQTLKTNIARIKEELRILYRRFGAEAASVGSAETASVLRQERKQFIDTLITVDDRETLDSTADLSRSIHDNEQAIEKLRASLAIDDEKAKIEKCLKLIEDKKARIAEAEKNIAEFEESIKDSEKYIEELQKLL